MPVRVSDRARGHQIPAAHVDEARLSPIVAEVCPLLAVRAARLSPFVEELLAVRAASLSPVVAGLSAVREAHRSSSRATRAASAYWI